MKTLKFLSCLLILQAIILTACEKTEIESEPTSYPEPAAWDNYREAWEGRYATTTPTWGRVWTSIVQGTDSLMFFRTNVGTAYLMSDTAIVHADGTIEYAGSDPLKELHGYFRGDSLRVIYNNQNPPTETHDFSCLKMSPLVPEPTK